MAIWAWHRPWKYESEVVSELHCVIENHSKISRKCFCWFQISFLSFVGLFRPLNHFLGVDFFGVTCQGAFDENSVSLLLTAGLIITCITGWTTYIFLIGSKVRQPVGNNSLSLYWLVGRCNLSSKHMDFEKWLVSRDECFLHNFYVLVIWRKYF